MERLGFWGIIKLTTHLLLIRNLKHFLCITLLFTLPSAVNFIVLAHQLKAFASTSYMFYKISTSQGPLNPSDLPPASDFPPSQQQNYPLSLSIFLAIFSLCISLLYIPLVTFSVCRACLNKSLDLKGSLRGVPRSVINLILTWLLEFVVIFAFTVVATLVMVIISKGLSAVHANVVIRMTVMTVGVLGGGICMAVALSLANTVAILEEKKGWEALSRSMYLIKGSRWVVVGLYGFYFVLGLAPFAPLLVTVSEKASVVWRWGAGGVSVGLQAFIAVCSMASMVVLFMSCKAGHGEPLDTLVAASAQFGPGESIGAKYLDVETAALTTTTQ